MRKQGKRKGQGEATVHDQCTGRLQLVSIISSQSCSSNRFILVNIVHAVSCVNWTSLFYSAE